MSQGIILPSQFSTLSENATHGVYEIGGLYPGYGHTLGNSLRRIILSSLPGAAVTTVKIEGVDHEFATYKGMKEDILSFVLNLKKLRVRLVGVSEATVELSIKGPKVVTASDITNLGGVVEIANPTEYLCELTDKVELKVEVTFTSGIGFIGREAIRREKLPSGTIVLDSVFSPIRKASYVVDNMRVGERTDYNRLEIAIETDGTITPREAFEQSLALMINQLRAIANLKEEFIDASFNASASLTAASLDESISSDEDDSHTDILKTRIDTLGLTTRVMNALSEANIRTLGGLVRKGEDDLLELEGLGSKGVDEIKEILTRFDLKLKD